MLKKIGVGLWSALLTIVLLLYLFDEKIMAENWKIFSEITPFMIVQNLFVVFAVVATCVCLMRIPFLKRSLYGRGRNINLIPAEINYFGPVFLLLLAIHLPYFAGWEERWFRAGTMDWEGGLYRSLIFGLIHCLVGVPLGAGLAITVGGLWFTHQYFVGGVDLSTAHHATYNLIVVSVMFVSSVIRTKDRVLSKKKLAVALDQIRGLARGQSDLSTDTLLVDRAEAVAQHPNLDRGTAKQLLEILNAYDGPAIWWMYRVGNSSRLSAIKGRLTEAMS